VVVFDDSSPIYQQIAAQIEDQIVSGELGGDEQVMSTNAYASFYRINPATAAKGFRQLVDEGILYKRRGLGMFVSPDAAETLRAKRRERFFAERVEPMVAEARMIGVPLDEIVKRINDSEGRRAQ
jgi:DNA-binding transcriptional regulator YhcF (GntR family)